MTRLIDADALAYEILSKYGADGGTKDVNTIYGMIINAPTIDAEPVKHGEWIEEKDGWYGGQGCRCSSCGYGYSYKAYHEPYEFDFCPNCGAKMDKE